MRTAGRQGGSLGRETVRCAHGEPSLRSGRRSAGPAPPLEGRTAPPATLMKGHSWPASPFRQLDAVTWRHLREKLPPAPMREQKFCLEYSAGFKGASSAILKPVLPREKNYNCHGNGDLELAVQKANHRARAQRPLSPCTQSRAERGGPAWQRGKSWIRACCGRLRALHTQCRLSL